MHYSVIHSFLPGHEATCSADITPVLNHELPLFLSGGGSLDGDHFISLVRISSTARSQSSVCRSLKQVSEPN